MIGNEWVDNVGLPLPVTAPATGRGFAWLAAGGAPEIDAAVRAALVGDWGRTTATERGRLMMAFAALVPSRAPCSGESISAHGASNHPKRPTSGIRKPG